ncbi:MAG: cell division protein FtsB [Methylococcales bacterium]|jgi:cell division protein FtsB|nr:cell division protein FtsB [Methylococcales bacterium]MBT3507033.1 cell division protein FtsB [Methylococcales bacterium]MBT3699502.1 cell division protein FtsB [Methylococcales bacterium]MBT3816272.1 cell division protein FtsB [Methylococcales bacterium]MBT4031349.1 cell division protein FtsB [Methylococcales bacterium]
MRILLGLISLLTVMLQYRLIFGEGSLQQISEYQQQIDILSQQDLLKKMRNDRIYREVLDLRKGDEALEERARNELGMIGKEETFYQYLQAESSPVTHRQ